MDTYRFVQTKVFYPLGVLSIINSAILSSHKHSVLKVSVCHRLLSVVVRRTQYCIMSMCMHTWIAPDPLLYYVPTPMYVAHKR